MSTETADGKVQKASSGMGRSMDTRDIRNVLHANFENPRWNEVAGRCLTLRKLHDGLSGLLLFDGGGCGRSRRGGSRAPPGLGLLFHRGLLLHPRREHQATPRARYRQWLTHKLGAWHDQFGVSGCVGCGRCITWCLVGIDITEEVKAIRTTGPEGHR